MNGGVEGTGEIREWNVFKDARTLDHPAHFRGTPGHISESVRLRNTGMETSRQPLTLIKRDEKGMGQNHLTLNRAGVPRERTSVVLFVVLGWIRPKTGVSILC